MGNEIEGSTLPEELPPLPCGWRYEALGDLVDDRGVCYGIVQPGSADARGVPIVRVNNIRDGRIDTANILRVSPGVESKFGRSRLRGGEVLLTLVGTLGEVAVVPHHLQGWNVARAVGVIPVREDPGAQWVAVCLRSGFIQRCIRAWATTTVQATFNLRDLAKLPIPVPPTRQRGGITSVLGALDDKIDLNRRMCQTLEEMARALFKSWFVDFDPVRAKMEGRDPGLPKEIADLFPSRLVDSELGPIPEGWRVDLMSDVVEIVDCLHSKKPERAEAGGWLLQLDNIRNDGLLDPIPKYLINDEDYTRWSAKFETRAGDCLVTNVGRVGAIAQIPEGVVAALGRNMTGLRPRPQFAYPTFLAIALLSPTMRAEIARKTDTGTILDALNVRSIGRLRLVRPDDRLLKHFEQCIRPFRARTEHTIRENATLAALRDTLLPKLISGELRVPASLGSMQEVATPDSSMEQSR